MEPHPDAGPVPDNVVEAEEELGAPALDVVQDDDLELPPVFGELRRDLFVDELRTRTQWALGAMGSGHGTWGRGRQPPGTPWEVVP